MTKIYKQITNQSIKKSKKYTKESEKVTKKEHPTKSNAQHLINNLAHAYRMRSAARTNISSLKMARMAK